MSVAVGELENKSSGREGPASEELMTGEGATGAVSRTFGHGCSVTVSEPLENV